LTSLSNLHHIEESKGLQSGELGGQISFDQWFFQFGLRPGWMILAVWAQSFKEFGALPAYFLAKDGLFTLHHTKDGQLSKDCRKQFL
jgi:hypothetical protein